jgi:hypothetical protein
MWPTGDGRIVLVRIALRSSALSSFSLGEKVARVARRMRASPQTPTHFARTLTPTPLP